MYEIVITERREGAEEIIVFSTCVEVLDKMRVFHAIHAGAPKQRKPRTPRVQKNSNAAAFGNPAID